MLRFFMAFLGLICVVTVYLAWISSTTIAELELHMLVATLEELYDECERDEKQYIAECGFKDRQEAIQQIVKFSSESAKNYKMVRWFAPLKRTRLSLAKGIERLEKNRDNFKALQEKQ